MQAEKSFSLKDQLFNLEKVTYLASLFKTVYSEFKEAAFIEEVVTPFPDLELKERIHHISQTLQKYLPASYPEALEIILKGLPPELDPTKNDDDFGDFIMSPLSQFVADYGCSAEYLEISLNGLEALTRRFSVEGPIRNFINAFPAETMAFLDRCADSDNYHVRRLASEGTRPKLPWAQKLVIDYTLPMPILDKLFADQTRYVTRSVANHLNDISKIDSALVIATLAKWKASGDQAEKEMAFVLSHSLRTLVKKGDGDALTLLGYGEVPEITVEKLETTTPEVVVGEAFLFSFEIHARKDQNLLVDYTMRFALESEGKRQGEKVFKLKQTAVKAGQVLKIKKRHPMRLMTTRRLYPGTHEITLQVNGKPLDKLTFELLAE